MDSDETNCAIEVLRRFDSNARISGVLNTDSSGLLKLSFSSECPATVQLDALAALRVAFPLSTLSAVENHATGHTELQLLTTPICGRRRQAIALFRDHKVFRILRLMAKICFGLSFTAWTCLMHEAHTAIRLVN